MQGADSAFEGGAQQNAFALLLGRVFLVLRWRRDLQAVEHLHDGRGILGSSLHPLFFRYCIESRLMREMSKLRTVAARRATSMATFRTGLSVVMVRTECPARAAGLAEVCG